MMQAQFKAWVVALGCSALVIIVPARSIAQTSPKDPMQQEVMRQQTLMFDGSQKVMDASMKMQGAMKLLEIDRDHSKSKQIIAEAERTMADGEKMIADARKTEVKLTEDLTRTGSAGRRIMEGARLVRSGMLMVMKDEQALSGAQKIVKQGNTMLEQGQKIVAAAQP
jgi:hypothetical protein